MINSVSLVEAQWIFVEIMNMAMYSDCAMNVIMKLGAQVFWEFVPCFKLKLAITRARKEMQVVAQIWPTDVLLGFLSVVIAESGVNV